MIFKKNTCLIIIRNFMTFPIIALQMGVFFSRMAPGYETAPTKQFYRGRTETLRSCTKDNKVWCEAMSDPGVKVRTSNIVLTFFYIYD